MINHPIVYRRDFRNDFPPLNLEESQEGFWEKCQRYALASLPLLSLHRPFRGPLSLTMSGFRSITHTAQMIEHLKKGNAKEGCFHFFHASLATAAVGLFFFNPVFCFLFSSVSDLIMNCRSLVENIKAGRLQESAEAFAFIALDLLFLISFCYGCIEITVACMIVQVILDFYMSAQHFKKGEYFEGMCQAVLGGAHIHQAVPQLKVLHWKWKYNPVLVAELKQDERGFVYLDIPDEYVRSLFELCDDPRAELPPYFGKGKAGAHVSVIPVDEMKAYGLTMQDIGKKFTFRIVNMDSVRPDGWKGVSKVYFLTLSCPELESLRMRRGLPPKIDHHDFHLTFGIEKEHSFEKMSVFNIQHRNF